MPTNLAEIFLWHGELLLIFGLLNCLYWSIVLPLIFLIFWQRIKKIQENLVLHNNQNGLEKTNDVELNPKIHMIRNPHPYQIKVIFLWYYDDVRVFALQIKLFDHCKKSKNTALFALEHAVLILKNRSVNELMNLCLYLVTISIRQYQRRYELIIKVIIWEMFEYFAIVHYYFNFAIFVHIVSVFLSNSTFWDSAL